MPHNETRWLAALATENLRQPPMRWHDRPLRGRYYQLVVASQAGEDA